MTSFYHKKNRNVFLSILIAGTNKGLVRKTKTKKPKSVQTATSLPPDVTKHSDEESVTKPGDDDETFFGSSKYLILM